VNTNPYLGLPNDYIKDLMPKMLDEMIKIVFSDDLVEPSEK